MEKKGLYENIAAKRKRISQGSGEKMRKPGSPGAPTAENFRESAKTAKPPAKEGMHKMPDGKMMKNSAMKKKPGVMAKAMGLTKGY
jgi:hypothetical protein